MIKSQVATISLKLLRIWLLRLIAFLIIPLLVLITFGQQDTFVLPSHPFIDDNGNGIDDFDESSGIYSDPNVTANVYDITFPIAELGDCTDFYNCLSYCEDPVNYNDCVDYSTEKGFYKDEPIFSDLENLYQQAKAELGCESATACIDYCEQVTNFDACNVFAKKLDLLGGYVTDPSEEEILARARDILGCETIDACLSFCDDPANATVCADFASQTGLIGGTVVEGPGGCISDATCQSYCADPNNFSECSEFVPPEEPFQGPGGCDGLGDCRSYCEINPDDCRSYSPGSNGVYVPISCGADHYFGPGGVCTPNDSAAEANACVTAGSFWAGTSCEPNPPPGISVGNNNAYFQPREDMGGCVTPGECYDYCSANPGSCGGFDPNQPRPDSGYVPSIYYTPGTPVTHDPIAEYGNCTSPAGCYDWCRENVGECTGFNPNSPRPTDTYLPNTYYTPPVDYSYYTPADDYYYITPIYYTPPAGSDYQTPTYYTPGTYISPSYYSPYDLSYVTPSYFTPTYYTPTGNYPTPSYYTPYDPANYPTPTYYTPPEGSNYVTPEYYTPGEYYTPYYTPDDSGYYYPTPDSGSYYSPAYYTPSDSNYYYPTPSDGGGYYYPTPSDSYGTPDYPTPSDSYGTPSYEYPTPDSYSYPTPSDSDTLGVKVGPIDRFLLFLGNIFGF